MTEDMSRYPVKRKLEAGREGVELSFKFLTKYKEAKVKYSGESVVCIIDQAGQRHSVGSASEDWAEICPGVQAKARKEYRRHFSTYATSEETQDVRVGAEACPVHILVSRRDACDHDVRRWSYHHQESYSVLVEA